ncbi:hypothetical protein ACSBR1_016907 [Camellia fascicularis]
MLFGCGVEALNSDAVKGSLRAYLHRLVRKAFHQCCRMSLVNAIQISPDKAAESFPEPEKHSKISYTREFLLSLSGLDVCKNLPSGFGRSTLSEFEDAFQAIQDRQRIPGSLPLQGYGRTDYGTSPPTRGDSSNYSRGSYGRWDNRSSGRNERDSDSQSDWDSDSGRRHSNQSRRSWQNSEHDGLLGSGSFPRPSGFPAGLSAPKVRSNDHSQLNRSTEPYQPPRPYKAVPHSRRENSDSFNDETFGSAECTSQDRAEEERRRRESFELMRKEQQKAFQEKQKLNPNKHKDDHVSDLCKLLGDTKEGKSVLNRSNELDEIVTQAVSNNDSSKSSLQTSAARPLVPPGFKSTTLEMSSSTRSLTHSHSAEVGKPEFEESLSHAKAIVQNGNINNQEERQLVQKMGFREQQHENTSIHSPSLNKGEQIVDSSTDLEVSNKKLGVDNQLYKTSSLSEASQTQDGSEIVEFDTKKVTGHKIISDSKQNHSTVVLEKIFGNVLTVDLSGSTGVIEHHDSEQDDTWSPNAVKSSKFADWFLEDEKKAAEDPSHTRPRNLLSLIVGGEKGGSQVSDVKATKHVLPDISFQNSEPTNWHLTSNMTSSTIGISEPLYNCSKQEAIPAILTCEDLEQTILSEYSESGSTLQDPVQIWSDSNTKTKVSKADIDDHASQHLLSLLQKGTDLKDMTESPNLDGGLLDKHNVSEGAIVGSALDNSRVEKVENIQHSGKNLTLETLFGSAFMKELQSVEAPVSIQRGSVGSARTDISEPHGSNFGVMGGGLFPASMVGVGSNRSSDESNILQSSQRQQLNSDKIENWLGINNTQVKVDPSKHQNDLVSKLGGFDGAVDIQLPEEENLITVGDPVNMSNTSNKPVVIAEKLSALNTVLKDIRPMVGREGPPFICSPYDPMEPEIPFGKLHAQQPSSPQFHPPRMNHGRPFFHPLDLHPTHASSQMNFMAPEVIVHRDAPTTRKFPVNMMRPPFHHPNTGSTGFDIPHQPVLQQMQMPGNYPPSHLRREVPRGGGPLPPHPSNHATGFMQELKSMQSFPFGQQQPKFGGLGMPSQAPDVTGGSNHPEVFQRLLEMERRANSKQIHPLAAVGHSQGMYGHELDMSFRYR